MKCYDEYASEYDAWFMKNGNLLASEVKLIAKTLADGGDILSIGCGSGLMESILKNDFGIVVADGVEPSLKRCGFFDLSYHQTLTMHPVGSNRFVEEPSEGKVAKRRRSRPHGPTRKTERRDRATTPPDRSGGRTCGLPRQKVNSLQSHPI